MNNEEKVLQMLEEIQQGQAVMKKQLETQNQNITRLESRVLHELELLNENLPGVIAKRESFEEMEIKVDDHGHRIFALEQAVGK